MTQDGNLVAQYIIALTPRERDLWHQVARLRDQPLSKLIRAAVRRDFGLDHKGNPLLGKRDEA